MAGRPLARACAKAIEDRAAVEGVTPAAYILAWLEDGRTLADLAREIGSSRPMVSRYAASLADKADIGAARAEGAHAMVDEALNILDASSADRDEVALAKARAEFRLKVAGKHNRPAYGEDKQVTAVQVNFGSLALDAMRTPVAAAQASPANVSPATRAIITGDAPAMLAAGSVTTASIAPDVEHVSDADA